MRNWRFYEIQLEVIICIKKHHGDENHVYFVFPPLDLTSQKLWILHIIPQVFTGPVSSATPSILPEALADFTQKQNADYDSTAILLMFVVR